MPKLNLKIKLLTSTAKMPTRSHQGDLYDIYADEDIEITAEPKLVSTGIALDIPKGFHVKIYNRSSNPLKYGLILSNSVGVIDTQYRGEVKGIFHCITHKENNFFGNNHIIHKGDKIMQMEMVPIYDFELEQVETLTETERGADGFGSTGK